MKFKDKTIVVTGGGSDPGLDIVGFGHQSAKDLFGEGASVSILGTQIHRLRDAAKRITGNEKGNNRFSYHACDVSDADRVREVFQLIKKTHGLIYGLVNNAAVNIRQPIASAEDDDLRRIAEVNYLGPQFCSKYAIQQMLEGGSGSLVHISSIAAKNRPLRNMAGYDASKYGIEGLSNSIASDYEAHGIRSNVIRPGYGETCLTKPLFDRDPEARERVASRQPLGGLVTPDQISAGILYLLDPACKKSGPPHLEISNGHIPE